ncbi:hypothetical protein BGZ72_006864 [Mortierella alpina]|nr:hypothetical protein BGZ72_006864 [Mortierella alpina]
MAFALFWPITELRLVLEQNQGWSVYFCQIPQHQEDSELSKLFKPNGTTASLPLLQIQERWAQNCAVLRARSVLTVLWVFLVLVEICIAYRTQEFHSRANLCSSSHGHESWSKARTERLIKTSLDSSSEVWSEEIVRVHDGDEDVDGNTENGYRYDYDDDYEETPTQYSAGQPRSSLQGHGYSHPPPEYHYAYRVEVLEPVLPPFVYNPFMTQSDCSFARLELAGSVTPASSITISSIDSSDSGYSPQRYQSNEVSRPWHHGCL